MPTDEQARALLEKMHLAWNQASLDGMRACVTEDLVFWCNAGDPAGGPVQFDTADDFLKTLEPVLATTRAKSEILSFGFDDEEARVNVRLRLQSLANGIVHVATYRQVVRYRGLRISRLEEYHDAARLTTFWKLHAEGAEADTAVWDVDPANNPAE